MSATDKSKLTRSSGAVIIAMGFISLALFLFTRVAFSARLPIQTPIIHSPASGLITYTIAITNGKPTAVGIYETGNKVYVADSLSGNLLAFDGTNRQLKASIPISVNVLTDNLVINESYHRAYAASRVSVGSDFGTGSGLVYVINLTNDTVLTTINLKPYMGSNRLTLAQDKTRNRIYVTDYQGMAYINVETNAVTTITLPSEIPNYYFLIDEMAVNETTNEVYLVQDTYTYHRLWILNANTWTWSSVDFTLLHARYPYHVAVSATANKVFVKLVFVPNQTEPGLYILNRNDDSHTFVGNDDYGQMVVNESSGRLYTGVEVGTHMATVNVATNNLSNLPMDGTTVAVGVRYSTDHAFLANATFVAIVDGASLTSLKIPVSNTPSGGVLVQAVAVNQSTGWAYVIPDQHLPEIIAVQDPPAGPLQRLVYLPLVLRNY